MYRRNFTVLIPVCKVWALLDPYFKSDNKTFTPIWIVLVVKNTYLIQKKKRRDEPYHPDIAAKRLSCQVKVHVLKLTTYLKTIKPITSIFFLFSYTQSTPTHRLILHGWTGNAPVQFVIIHQTHFYQVLNWQLILKNQETVTWNTQSHILYKI